MSEYLKVGTEAPNFTLKDSHGKEHALSDYRGKKVVLYFYPKDNTSGCTTEACDYKERQQLFTEKNAVIIGISKDGVRSHLNFQTKYELPFVLLSDVKKVVCEQYGVMRLKKMYGKEYMGIVRSTYVINEEGIIEKVYGNVKVKGHAQKVLDEMES